MFTLINVVSAIQVLPTFDIRALWRSALSARVPECQKSTMCNIWQLCPLKG